MKIKMLKTSATGIIIFGASVTIQTLIPVAHSDPYYQWCTPEQVQSGAGLGQCWQPGCPNPTYNNSIYQDCVLGQMFPTQPPVYNPNPGWHGNYGGIP
jgi:hypothetical protein